jgi:hypothetical protein
MLRGPSAQLHIGAYVASSAALESGTALSRRTKGEAMEPTRALTVHFIDGSKVSFGFPNQAANASHRQIRFEEFLKSPFLLVVADGVLTALPVANIKAIQFPVDDALMKDVRLPEHVIQGATVTRGEL